MWVGLLRADERVFWRTMNPVRCHAIYNALYPQEKKRSAQEPQSLLQYMTGGGG